MSKQDPLLSKIDYKLPLKGKSKWGIILAFSFICGFILYFPLIHIVSNIIQKQITSIPNCPMTLKEVKFEVFLPKLILEKVRIPKGCSNTANDIQISTITLNFRGISFSPLGPHFLLETKIFDTNFSSYQSIGLSTQTLNIKENKLKADFIENFLPPNVSIDLDGDILIDAFISIQSMKMNKIKASIRSRNLMLPAQTLNIGGLPQRIPNLVINNLLLKLDMDNGDKLEIQEVILGDEYSPIRLNIKGDISAISKGFSNSRLNIKGELAFSKEFIEQYSIIQLFLGKFDKKDEFYQINVSGPISNPKFN